MAIPSYILLFIDLIPSLLALIVYDFRYGSDPIKSRRVYSGALLFSSFSYFSYKTIIQKIEVESLREDHIKNPWKWIIYSSIFSFFLGFFKVSHKSDVLKGEKHNLAYYIILFISFLFITGACFIQINFEDLTMAQIIFIMNAGKNEGSTVFFVSYLKIGIFCSIALTAFYLLLINNLTRYYRVNLWREFRIYIYNHYVILLFLVFSFIIFMQQTPFGKIFNSDDPFIKNHYVFPKKTKLTWPEKKRNLVLLVLESIESSFSSKEFGGFFPNDDNLIPNLTHLALDPHYVHFSNTDKIGGGLMSKLSDWSAAGIFSMASGLPYKTDPKNPKTAFPNAYTLFELTEDNGYETIFLKGNKEGYGVGPILYTHSKKLTYIFGPDIRASAKKYNKLMKGFGGSVPDYALYDYTLDFLKNRKSKKPFVLWMEATSTHFPNGFLCEKCIRKHKWRYYDVIQCADRETKKFIEDIQNIPIYKDTTVAVIGDHLTMSKNMGKIIHDFNRTSYNLLFNSAVKAAKNSTRNRQFMTYDWFPTLVASMGIKINGDRLGLGTNLFSGKKTLAEKYGNNYINNVFEKDSIFFMANFLSQEKGNCPNIKARAYWKVKASPKF